MHDSIHIYMHVCRYAYMNLYVCMYGWMDVGRHVCMYVCKDGQIRQLHECIYVCVHIYTYIHTYKENVIP